MIEIIEEISAIIRIDDVKETMEIAKELRDSISASQLSTDEDISQEKTIETREKQANLAQRLQIALSALQVQVLEGAQELAPELSTEVLQRIAKVTGQLEADLVAVTGIRVAVQAPSEPIKETVEVIESTDRQTASVCPTGSELVAITSESIVLEQGDIEESQSFINEQLIATTEMLERQVADTKEVVMLKDTTDMTVETAIESTEEPHEISLSGSEIVLAEHTTDVPIERAHVAEDTKIEDSTINIVEGIISEEQVMQEMAVSKPEVGEIVYQAADIIELTSKATIGNASLYLACLVQYYIS